MKLKILLTISIILIISACSNQNENQVLEQKGSDYMQWEDDYYMEVCSQVFDKPGEQITYEDVAEIVKIVHLYIEKEHKISVYLSNVSEPIIVGRPEISIKSVADLTHFKNLSYLELFCNKFVGIEVFKHMPKLKTLDLRGDVDNNLLSEISESDYIESLTVPFLDIDYSVLAQMKSLKTVTLAESLLAPPDNYAPLLSLPRENCLIDLGFIYYEDITPELYEVLSTHTNISNIGKLSNGDNYDLGFLEDMKNLTSLNINTDDVKSISKMTWLKELNVIGNFDVSQLSGLSNLESLILYTPTEQVITLDFLANMKKLNNLELYKYIVYSLDGIEVCRELKTLTCYSCLLEDISALRQLSQLEQLKLIDNLITDISPIQSLTKLKYVSLDANEISDITPLKNCTDIEFLCLDGNYISDIRVLSNFSKLTDLQIEIDDPDTKEAIDINLWRNTLLSLPNLKFYAGGIDNNNWLKENLPNVICGRSDVSPYAY